jgi:Flp pilus assembly pilin Flp
MVVTTLYPVGPFFKPCRGASATEYAMMALGLAVVIVLGCNAFGAAISASLANVGNYISSETPVL